VANDGIWVVLLMLAIVGLGMLLWRNRSRGNREATPPVNTHRVRVIDPGRTAGGEQPRPPAVGRVRVLHAGGGAAAGIAPAPDFAPLAATAVPPRCGVCHHVLQAGRDAYRHSVAGCGQAVHGRCLRERAGGQCPGPCRGGAMYPQV